MLRHDQAHPRPGPRRHPLAACRAWSSCRTVVGSGGFDGQRDPSERINSPQLDQLLEQGPALSNPQQRIPLYQQAQKITMDNAYGVFNWQDDYDWVTQSCVNGWAWDPIGSYMPHDVWLSGSCRSITG
ncbi:MAG TPA: hypothetical protein VNM16_03770 [Bacillota bacterium]|nr:hypothetical protein [Bacillota bacterium]